MKDQIEGGLVGETWVLDLVIFFVHFESPCPSTAVDVRLPMVWSWSCFTVPTGRGKLWNYSWFWSQVFVWNLKSGQCVNLST